MHRSSHVCKGLEDQRSLYAKLRNGLRADSSCAFGLTLASSRESTGTNAAPKATAIGRGERMEIARHGAVTTGRKAVQDREMSLFDA